MKNARRRLNRVACIWSLLTVVVIGGPGKGQGQAQPETSPETLPETARLEMEGDLASRLVSGVDRFLLRKLAESVGSREAYWQRDFSSHRAYEESISGQRERLRHILGVRDDRVPFEAPELVAQVGQASDLGRGRGYTILRVRWPAFGDVHGDGLLLEPDRASDAASMIQVVALPDADQTPEQLVGLVDGIPPGSQFARRLAEAGCRVLVPSMISRQMERRHPPGHGGRANLTHREYLYRSAYELGRHLIGYELQKVFAAVDWFSRSAGEAPRIGVMGYGEGGMLALYAGALDPRIASVGVSGYFNRREGLWAEPISRNVFGLLEQFGDAELATMVVPRALTIENSEGPRVTLPSEGGAPAQLEPPRLSDVRAEFNRARALVEPLKPRLELVSEAAGFGTSAALRSFLRPLGFSGSIPQGEVQASPTRPMVDGERRLRAQLEEMDRHTQRLLVDSPYVRKAFMADLKTDSLEAYEASSAAYREFFHEEVIGRFGDPVLPFNARSRKAYDAETWEGYEVVLDVYPDVMAYGILCLPKGMAKNERRPVVVCQHGLEGRPQDIVEGDHRAYHDFASRLAERGFVTFSPQNLYIFRDRFRSLQRKAYPLKKTLFSIMIPQHQQIVDWLKTQPFVDPERIAFYGLSYGGKTAMRVPSVVTDYCLSICSADFNEWVWKNASTRSPYSYVWSGEYEIFEFDLGSTFNYAEMASLIAPRPFMVERGHFDGVAPDETVAYEFAKVRFLYAAKLGIADRCEIEWFAGPHTINGEATYQFLHRHLNWPVPQ